MPKEATPKIQVEAKPQTPIREANAEQEVDSQKKNINDKAQEAAPQGSQPLDNNSVHSPPAAQAQNKAGITDTSTAPAKPAVTVKPVVKVSIPKNYAGKARKDKKPNGNRSNSSDRAFGAPEVLLNSQNQPTSKRKKKFAMKSQPTN